MSFQSTIVLPISRGVKAILLGLVLGCVSAYVMELSYPKFDALKLHEWTAYPTVAKTTADAYAKAARAQLADLPMDPTVGLEFFASKDQNGNPMLLSCSYELDLALPPTRLWSLVAVADVQDTQWAGQTATGADADGQSLLKGHKPAQWFAAGVLDGAWTGAHVVQTHATPTATLISGDVVYDAQGGARIFISRQAFPGNWLKPPEDGWRGAQSDDASLNNSDSIKNRGLRFRLVLHLYGLLVNAEYFRLHTERLPVIARRACQD